MLPKSEVKIRCDERKRLSWKQAQKWCDHSGAHSREKFRDPFDYRVSNSYKAQSGHCDCSSHALKRVAKPLSSGGITSAPPGKSHAAMPMLATNMSREIKKLQQSEARYFKFGEQRKGLIHQYSTERMTAGRKATEFLQGPRK